jgi:GNAT superfamily N-acetyltransferase
MSGNSPASIGFIEAQRPSDGAADGEPALARLAVAPAGLADLPRVVDLVAGAFLHDPTWSWAFPDPAVRRRWWETCLESALRYPWTLTTEGLEVAAVWIPPKGTEFSHATEEGLPKLLGELVGSRAAEVAELLRRFEAAHPRREPHYYLSLLGTRAADRGHGLGMALLRENLARIDAEGMPAYLESSNPANNHRYASVGFETVVSFRAPGDGPLVTGMWRRGR